MRVQSSALWMRVRGKRMMRVHCVIFCHGLEHTETKRCATNAAARQTKCRPVEFVERAVELSPALTLAYWKPLGVAVIRVKPRPFLLGVLAPQYEPLSPARAMDRVRFRGQHFFDR